MGEFKKAKDEFQRELDQAQIEAERPAPPAQPQEKRQPVANVDV
jgi:Sec-independent protein translocase protein TatA